MQQQNSPAALGFHMPAEWEKHSATWLTWPQNLTYWPDGDMQQMEILYTEMIRALTEGEDIELLVNSSAKAQEVSRLLRQEQINLRRVHLHVIPSNDIWIRDYGPNFIVNRTLQQAALAHNRWLFNSWGEKYGFHDDAAAADTIAERRELYAFYPGIVLEGGSIEVNGRGACLTTEQCLLNQNRNAQLQREDVEVYLRAHLGVSKVIWCKGGVQGDDTDGHIDNLARFVNPSTVVCAWEDDTNDPNHANLRANYEALLAAADQNGNKLNVIRMPMPGRVGTAEQRLPASYVNFYIGNAAVLAPIYGHANDKAALDLLHGLFPDREIVGLRCNTLVQGYGGIHCITQQQPVP